MFVPLLRKAACCFIGAILWCGAESSLAQSPNVAVFSYLDSLAVTLDCERFFTPERIEKLNRGYPVSFTVDFSLRKESTLWPDVTVNSCRVRFRVTHRDLDRMFEFEFSSAKTLLVHRTFLSLEDIKQELEDRLFLTFGKVADLDDSERYYIEVSIGYRNLGLEDVRSAQQWLDGKGSTADSNSGGDSKPSLGESVIGLLWEVAGLGGDTERFSSARFRPGELRHGD